MTTLYARRRWATLPGEPTPVDALDPPDVLTMPFTDAQARALLAIGLEDTLYPAETPDDGEGC